MKNCKRCGLEFRKCDMRSGVCFPCSRIRAREYLDKRGPMLCPKCKVNTVITKSPYCTPCMRHYNSVRVRGMKKKDREAIKLKAIELVEKIIRNKMMVDFNDINDIITYYMDLAKNSGEFDSYKGGRQINLMFNKLKKLK